MTPPILKPDNLPTEPGWYCRQTANGQISYRYITYGKSGKLFSASETGYTSGLVVSAKPEHIWSDRLPEPIVLPPEPRLGYFLNDGYQEYVLSVGEEAYQASRVSFLEDLNNQTKDKVTWYDEPTPIEEQA